MKESCWASLLFRQLFVLKRLKQKRNRHCKSSLREPAIKLAPRGRWQGRIDGSNYFYRIRYPESYFTQSTADPTVLVPGSSRNLWRRNLGVTVGVTYNYGR